MVVLPMMVGATVQLQKIVGATVKDGGCKITISKDGGCNAPAAPTQVTPMSQRVLFFDLILVIAENLASQT